MAPLITFLRDGTPLQEDLCGPETLHLWRQKDRLNLHNGELCIHSGGRSRVVCPTKQRRSLVRRVHEEAHLGASKLCLKLKQTWYWLGIDRIVRQVVRQCTACQQAKAAPAPGPRQNHLYAGRPWQVLAIDLCGPFPETEAGNTEILVVADHFTRWYDAIPIPDGRASTVARVLDERVFAYFGIPERVHSDQGAQFQSELFQACCQLWGCTKTQTAPYRPQGNSVVERLNRTLGNSLRALLLDYQHKEWDRLLPQIMRTVRATPHRITGETANYMMLGRETRLPPDIHHPVSPLEYTEDAYIQELQERLQEAGEKLRQQQTAKLRTEDHEDPPQYAPGDLVWLKSYFKGRGRGTKLQPKYVGPYEVVRSLPHQVYKLKRNGQTSVQHEGRIWAYAAPGDPPGVGRYPPRGGPRRRGIWSRPPTPRNRASFHSG